MERTSGRRKAAPRRAEAREGNTDGSAVAPLLAAEAPLLLALGLAPVVAGYQDPMPLLWLGCLVWLSFLLRLTLGPEPLRLPRLWWLALPVPVLALFSLFVSVTPGATLLQVLVFATCALALVLSTDIVRRGGAARLVTALLAGALIAAGLGLREYGEHWRAGEVGWRTFGPFTNPNFFAGYLAPALLLTLSLALFRPEAFKPPVWLLVLVLLTAALGGALVAAGSRGGLLSLAAGGLVFLVVAGVRGDLRGRESWVRLAVGGAVILAALALFSTPLRDRGGAAALPPLPAELCPETGDTATSDSNRFRALTWQGTLNMARKRPLLGWGAGTFETAFPPHQVAGYTRHAHNSYLQLFAEQGFLAPLAWVALLLAAFISAWRLPRGPEWAWAAGVAGALAASAAHNLLDSLLYVPAIGLLTWSLAGMGLAGTQNQPEHAAEPLPRKGTAGPLRTAAVVGAVLGLLVTGGHAFGRSILAAGREELRLHPRTAIDTLTTAARLLPFDHQVAVAQAQAYRAAYQFDQAIAEAGRALRLAPYRPPSYALLADLRSFVGQGDQALYQYAAGVRNVPREVQLLYPYAQLLEKVYRRQDALDIYRQIAAIEASPIGQVRALGEVRDYRPARAHVQLAIAADTARRPDEALAHRKAAACILAQRRRLFTNNPASYIALGDWEPQVERELRAEEGSLWRRLAQDYRARGENHLADLAQQQVTAVDESRAPLEKVISEVEEAARAP